MIITEEIRAAMKPIRRAPFASQFHIHEGYPPFVETGISMHMGLLVSRRMEPHLTQKAVTMDTRCQPITMGHHFNRSHSGN